ncbi:MAG: diaminopimelate epimerase [Clostridia bacterium]|nr:diaminopimelate epimerase [Clostridia bacterium]
MMRFTKMQSCGNDYVYVTAFGKPLAALPKLARFCSDRHRGIGSDGLIVICGSEKCDIRMRVFNPDGTEAEMCGNALRSAAALARMKGIICKDDITVETLGGEKSVRILSLDGGYCIAKIDLGVPEGFKAYEEPVSVRGRKFEISVLSFGNPHIAAFTAGVDRLNIKKYGPPLEKSGYFPNGANVHFYSVSPGGEIAARSWERGCGETLSCATGAAAAFAAARARGICGLRAYVRHPGGTLLAESDENGRIFVTGETRLVFEGELLPEDIV